MTVTDTDASELTERFTEQWRSWHTSRLEAAPDIASNIGTHWLTDQPQTLPDLPGLWWHEGTSSRGRKIPEDVALTDHQGNPLTPGSISIPPGQSVHVGTLRVAHINREGNIAARIFDPQAPTRTELIDIQTFEPDPKWLTQGRYIPSPDNTTVRTSHVDGWESEELSAGSIEFDLEEHHYSFEVSPSSHGFLAVFRDESNGKQTKQFRFLNIAHPDDDGIVIVDFNRAYLPPCSFAPYYLCPLPPASNKIVTPVLAGEARQLYRENNS